MRSVPIYDLRSWALRTQDANHVVYRPTIRTVLLRFRWTLFCTVLALLLLYSTREFRDPPAPLTLTESEGELAVGGNREERERLLDQVGQEDLDRTTEEIIQRNVVHDAVTTAERERFEKIRMGMLGGVDALFAVLVVLGLLPPLTCLWARVAIHTNSRGELTISRVSLWPRRRHWPQGHFAGIATWAMERYRFSPHGGIQKHAREWIVQLSPAGLPSMPFVGNGVFAAEEMSPLFLVYRQKRQPAPKERAPEPVREFVKILRGLSNLPAHPPKVVEGRLTRGFLRLRIMPSAPYTVTETLPISSETHTYASFEEIPREVREKMIEMLRTGDVTRHPDGTIEAVSQNIECTKTLKGDEIETNWHEIPPQMREEIERIRRKRD